MLRQLHGSIRLLWSDSLVQHFCHAFYSTAFQNCNGFSCEKALKALKYSLGNLREKFKIF